MKVAQSHTLTVSVSDGSAAVTNTVVISVDDVNDQTPTFSDATAGAINYAEGATTAVDSFTITDTDTSGLVKLMLRAVLMHLYSLVQFLEVFTLTVSWDASPDFETQADADSNGVYVYTITVSDGTNDANAVTYTITVTDVVIDIAAASATIDETVANGFSVVQLSSTGDSQLRDGILNFSWK